MLILMMMTVILQGASVELDLIKISVVRLWAGLDAQILLLSHNVVATISPI